MKKNFLCLPLILALCAAASATDQAYDDPAMHFSAPAAFSKVSMDAPKVEEVQHLTPIAAYVAKQGERDQRTIIISMEPWESNAKTFEATVESELRGAADGLIVKSKDETRLANGMPAYWLKILYGSGFNAAVQYMYATVDGRRGITVAITAPVGTITEDEAKQALSDLSVVLYPNR